MEQDCGIIAHIRLNKMKGENMKKMKGLLMGIAVFTISLSASFVSMAGWQQDENGRKYQFEDGAYAADAIYPGGEENEEVFYYFGPDGYVKTGWIESEGFWYYGNEDGKLVDNWQWIDGNQDGIYEKYLFYRNVLYSSMYEASQYGREFAETINGVRVYKTPDDFYINENGARVNSDGIVLQADEAGAKADPDLELENLYMSSIRLQNDMED